MLAAQLFRQLFVIVVALHATFSVLGVPQDSRGDRFK